MHKNFSETRDMEYYRQIVDLANVAIVKFDKNFILTDFTGNSEYIFEFKKEEVIGKSLYDTIVPQFDSTGKDLRSMMFDITASIQSFEYNINENITKSGKRLWIQWFNSEIRNDGNDSSGFLAIGIDITDRINAEIALKESEERFKTLSDLTFEGILIHDKGSILDVNLTVERYTGFSREELIGADLFEKLLDKKYKKIAIEKATDRIVSYEAVIRRKDGTSIPVFIESRETKIGNRKVRVAAVRDISELKKTINELNQYKNHLEEIVKQRTEEIKNQSRELKRQNDILHLERNQLRTIIDNIPDLIYIKDKKGRFLNSNHKHIVHLKQSNLEDVTGKTDFDFYEEKYAQNYHNDEIEILKTGKPIINKEEVSMNEKGRKIFLSTTKVPLKDKNDQILGIVGIGRDITEKKLAERELIDFNEKLEITNRELTEQKEELITTLEQLTKTQHHLIQSEKMASLGVLMAGIAHEINNPVNFIYAGVNSAIRDFEDIKAVLDKIAAIHKNSYEIIDLLKSIEQIKEEKEFNEAFSGITETFQDIKLGATRIKEIVNGLSRFSRIEIENWKKADIHEEIENVLILLKNKYKHLITISRNYSEGLPRVECYPGKLEQVFMNIINNAIDAIEKEQGTITITTGLDRKNAGMIFISVNDSGKGIKEENKSRIFDPFFTTKDVGLGMGLGLAISYSIIQEHKGEITFKSEPGKGTEFIIKLPIVQIDNEEL